MKKPILKIKVSTLGTTLVFRSPLSRKWLFNITLSLPKKETHVVKNLLLALPILVLVHCTNPTQPDSTPVKATPVSVVSNLVDTRYVSDSLVEFKSCWYTTKVDSTKDSLNIDAKKYSISSRSRYRLTTEPTTFGDIEAEGAVKLINIKFFTDTKSLNKSIIVLNRCGDK